MPSVPEEPVDPFVRAMTALRGARLRPEVLVEEAPAPQRLAPQSVALTADVLVEDEELASGRFVLLHDPAGHDTWAGTFRAVTYVRAALEPEMAGDVLVTTVAWTWLMEALANHGAGFHSPSGTVTRVTSDSFGAMAERPPAAELEIRASWTPDDPDVGRHLEAWADVLCQAGGLPPLPQGVVTLGHRRVAPR
jgi:hypothetical protein